MEFHKPKNTFWAAKCAFLMEVHTVKHRSHHLVLINYGIAYKHKHFFRPTSAHSLWNFPAQAIFWTSYVPILMKFPFANTFLGHLCAHPNEIITLTLFWASYVPILMEFPTPQTSDPVET